MNYLLDTNACIAIMDGRPATVREDLRSRWLTAAIAVSSIVTFELWYGVGDSQQKRRNAERLHTFLDGAPFDVLPFDDEDAEIAGAERARLEAAGTPIGPYDLLIAAQALRRQRVLVTANAREFSRLHGLVWQDWATNAAH